MILNYEDVLEIQSMEIQEISCVSASMNLNIAVSHGQFFNFM